MNMTFDLWMPIVGALCGLGAVYGARGRNKLIMGAAIGAVIAVALGILRGVL